MKKTLHLTTLIDKITFPLLLILSFISSQVVIGQATVVKPFTQRAASATPTQLNYRIKGDFTMIGNTNLTLAKYGNTTNNNSQSMIFVDVDSDASTFNSSSATLQLSNENGALTNCSRILYAGLYWTGRSSGSQYTFNVTKGGITKNFDKRTVSIKGPGASTYTAVTAANSDIQYPATLSANQGIYVGYKEITDYVKANGAGNYTVADLAIVEGAGDSVGFIGGWGIVVIYENDLMKYRDVTLFDGYALVVSNGDQFGEIPVSGFKTVPSGPVKMKLGVMASEGDAGVTGDYLKIRNNTLTNPGNPSDPANYTSLSHSGNAVDNFFNSSIFTGGNARNPDLINNTGVDLSMFEINNPGNSILGNNQTNTTFRYGTVGELYVIFGLAMSVETYVPEPEGFIGVNSIDGVTTPPQPYTVTPGKSISYTLNIKNRGTEAINNTIVNIPISNTINFELGSITITKSADVITGNLPYFDSATSTIIWDMGTLPLPLNSNDLLATLTFKAKATEDCAVLINYSCNSIISVSGTITGIGAVSGNTVTRSIFKGFDNSAGCNTAVSSPTTVTLDGSNSSCFINIAGPDTAPPVCGIDSVNLSATAGTIGSWSIVSGPAGGGEIFSNYNSPTAEFSSPNTGVYTLRWTIPFGGGSCTPIVDDALVSIGLCNKLDFDGIDDNVNLKNNYNLNTGSFSIETWIKPGASNAGIQTIFSKRSSSALTDGYDLRIVNNVVSFNWNNGNAITSNYAINTGRWYHIAVTFNGTSYNLYIDGISVKNAVTGVNPIANTNAKCFLGAMIQGSSYPYLPTNYFKGWMQELRIWNVELTTAQTRQMMNQRITNTSSNVLGAIVPLTIPGLSWSNLEGYYQMTQSTDILNGFLIDKTSNLRNGKLIGIVTAQPETAPLPYTSTAHTAWETNGTWTNGSVWNLPNTLGVDGSTYIDWNIVKTTNNITTAGNKTLLGLLVESNTLEANSNNKIEVTHYLKVNGKIDLVGKSQLIQTEGSILETTSSGFIERDQLGQSNKYNYNYWSSPVSPINTTQNNKDYTVADVMKDGSTTTPQNINWVGGYDGSPTGPISVARYWLYKFDSLNNDYANWTQFLETAPLRVGLGYTMKGSGSALGNQTYTFVGKPNNGTIASNTVGDDQLLLTGNPYPSAIDADAFINDNIVANESFSSPSIDGTLYFWEHYATNNTHVLRAYQGGYAVRNLTGGIAPSSSGVDFITQSGTPSRGIPNRFIPIGQGFFVNGKIGSGGTITFKNSQRGFHKEDDATFSNVMFKTKRDAKQTWKSNANDTETADTHKSIRLGFNSYNDFHRQVLMGFMNEKATAGIDAGYDGLNIDDFPNDMYFLNGDNQLVIQGEGYFDTNASYPLGVKTDAEGKATFNLDQIKNFDAQQRFYIYDKLTDSYNDITTTPFEVVLKEGDVQDRFYLRFINGKTLNTKEFSNQADAIMIRYAQKQNTLIVNNPTDIEITEITLYNILGQNILNSKIKNQDQQEIKIPIKNLVPGVYITKVQTATTTMSKKIIIP
jgi:uncharacterized repeat protein (TIGR01451 family)